MQFTDTKAEWEVYAHRIMDERWKKLITVHNHMGTVQYSCINCRPGHSIGTLEIETTVQDMDALITIPIDIIVEVVIIHEDS